MSHGQSHFFKYKCSSSSNSSNYKSYSIHPTSWGCIILLSIFFLFSHPSFFCVFLFFLTKIISTTLLLVPRLSIKQLIWTDKCRLVASPGTAVRYCFRRTVQKSVEVSVLSLLVPQEFPGHLLCSSHHRYWSFAQECLVRWCLQCCLRYFHPPPLALSLLHNHCLHCAHWC